MSGNRRPYDGPERQAVPLDPIEACPGFFKTTLVKDGAEVPARLWKEERRDPETGELIADVKYFAEIWLEPTDPFDPLRWPWRAIEEPEFRYLVDDLTYCLKHKPHAPICNPYLPKRMAPAEYF